MPGRKLRYDEILPFLGEIGVELESRGLTAEMYIGGGAAIAVRYGRDARELTDDVDGAFQKDIAVLDIAARIAQREGLQLDWVNDKFTGFVPGAQPDTFADTHELGGLTVRFASDQFLLAMKMQAGRAKDIADTRMLIRRLRLHRAADIAALTCDLYGDEAVPAVDFDDMRFHATRMLRGIRAADPTWPVDPDDPPTPAMQAQATGDIQRRKTSPASNAGSFAHKRNVPPMSHLDA